MIRLGSKLTPPGTEPAGPDRGIGRSHAIHVEDLDAFARLHREKGYRAAYCPPVSIGDAERLRDIRSAFEAQDVLIAEVGAWHNPLHPDPREAAAERQRLAEGLAVAEEVNARCAISLIGSLVTADAKIWHERNIGDEAFDAAVEVARAIIDEVRPRRASLVFEIYPFSVNDTPANIRRLLDAVDRDRFGAHMDLVNLVNCPRAYFGNADILAESLRLFGDRIVSAHAKDVAMARGEGRSMSAAISVVLEEVRPGLGGIDYAAYLRGLHGLPHTVPLMLEHLEDQIAYDAAAEYIRGVAAAEGIDLEAPG